MSVADRSLSHLPPAAAGLGYAAARPRAVAIASVIGLTVLGWLWLGLMAAPRPNLWEMLCSVRQAASPTDEKKQKAAIISFAQEKARRERAHGPARRRDDHRRALTLRRMLQAHPGGAHPVRATSR